MLTGGRGGGGGRVTRAGRNAGRGGGAGWGAWAGSGSGVASGVSWGVGQGSFQPGPKSHSAIGSVGGGEGERRGNACSSELEYSDGESGVKVEGLDTGGSEVQWLVRAEFCN